MGWSEGGGKLSFLQIPRAGGPPHQIADLRLFDALLDWRPKPGMKRLHATR